MANGIKIFYEENILKDKKTKQVRWWKKEGDEIREIQEDVEAKTKVVTVLCGWTDDTKEEYVDELREQWIRARRWVWEEKERW